MAASVDAVWAVPTDEPGAYAGGRSSTVGVLIGAEAPVMFDGRPAHREEQGWGLFWPVGGVETMSVIGEDRVAARAAADVWSGGEAITARLGSASLPEAHDRLIVCTRGGPPAAQRALSEHMPHLSTESASCGKGGNASALLLRAFDARVACGLRISVLVGCLGSASWLPLATVLMGEGRLRPWRAAGGRAAGGSAAGGGTAAMYASGDGTTGSVCTLTSDGSAVASELRVLSGLGQRRHHTPAAFDALRARIAAVDSRVAAYRGASESELMRPGGSYYLREVTTIGQREYEAVELTSVRPRRHPAARTSRLNVPCPDARALPPSNPSPPLHTRAQVLYPPTPLRPQPSPARGGGGSSGGSGVGGAVAARVHAPRERRGSIGSGGGGGGRRGSLDGRVAVSDGRVGRRPSDPSSDPSRRPSDARSEAADLAATLANLFCTGEGSGSGFKMRRPSGEARPSDPLKGWSRPSDPLKGWSRRPSRSSERRPSDPLRPSEPLQSWRPMPLARGQLAIDVARAAREVHLIGTELLRGAPCRADEPQTPVHVAGPRRMACAVHVASPRRMACTCILPILALSVPQGRSRRTCPSWKLGSTLLG